VSKPIYSQQLANDSFSAPGTYLLYTVPAATVVVVTNIDYFVEASASAQQSWLELKNAIVAYSISAAAAVVAPQWSGRQVLGAGDTISLFTQGSNPRVAVTGYVLGP
jgi:hypothetical protein